LAWLLSGPLLLHHADSKREVGTVHIGGSQADGRWQYISKFGFGLGEGSYDVRIRFVSPPDIPTGPSTLALSLFLDEDWDRLGKLKPCSLTFEGLSRRTWQLPVRVPGEWGNWQSGAVFNGIRSHIWYFTLSSCELRSNSTLAVDFEFRARQPDGSEFGVEARYMLLVHVLALVVSGAWLTKYTDCCVCFARSAGTLHPVIWGLSLAVFLQVISQVLHAVHLWHYRRDGEGIWEMDTLSENLAMTSQVVHTALLIAIARGYTLLRSASELGCFKPVVAVTLLAHIGLVGFGKMHDGADKHHENEGFVGWAILAIRVGLYAWFVRALQELQRKAGLRLQHFLQQFQLAGSAYFLAYPLLFLVVQLFAPYLRHPILQVGLLAMQLTSNTWLATLFLRRGSYFKLSTLSDTLLPSGCKDT